MFLFLVCDAKNSELITTVIKRLRSKTVSNDMFL